MVSVPFEAVGMVIGRGGETIRARGGSGGGETCGHHAEVASGLAFDTVAQVRTLWIRVDSYIIK